MPFEQGANLPRVKVSNQSAILRTIYHNGPIKRAEIAQRLGLTLPTITTNVNTMIAAGIVRETGEAVSGEGYVGRKAHPVDIVPESRHFIGLEIQGGWRTACLLDFRGQLLCGCRDETPCRDYGKNLELARAMIHKILSSCGLRVSDLAGLGVCAPGLVSSERGMLDLRPSYSWFQKDLRGDVAALLGYGGSISVENNACARAYGAQLLQREILGGAQTFAYLFISEGIACPLVLNTASSFGSIVGAGEVGHMVMEPNGLPCSCGNRGCLEAYSSDRAVIARCEEAMERGEVPGLKELCGGRTPSMAELLERQAEGDAAVRETVEKAVYTLGVAVANIINFACPSMMLIEGKLFQLQENRDSLLQTVRRNLCNVIRSDTEYVFVAPDSFSGARGAAAMAICKDLETYNQIG